METTATLRIATVTVTSSNDFWIVSPDAIQGTGGDHSHRPFAMEENGQYEEIN